MVLYAGPKTDMHIHMVLLPAVVDHGVHHAYCGLTELFEGQVLVLCDTGFVVCDDGGDEGVSSILARYDG